VFCLFPIQLQGGPRSLVHLQPAPSYFVTMSCLGLGTPKSTNHAWDPHAWCLGLPCLGLPCLVLGTPMLGTPMLGTPMLGTPMLGTYY
jgi:hypothetical protein